MKKNTRFVGLDVHKDTITIAVAEKRGGSAYDYGTIANNWYALDKVLKELSDGYPLRICYEAGPTGFELARRISGAGYWCQVVAPALVPRRPGDRVKTDRRDARKLAHFLRSGDLTEVCLPSMQTEAMRDLERARGNAKRAQQVARQQLDKFLLRHGRIWSRPTKWTKAHHEWIGSQEFSEEAHRRVLTDYRDALREASARVARLDDSIEELVEKWALRPLVVAFQAARGPLAACRQATSGRLTSAVILAAEIGDFARFATARQFMAFVGLAVSEKSSGQCRSQGHITRTGNQHVRRILTEAAWLYRFAPRPSKAIQARAALAPEEVQKIARKAERRLHQKFYRLLNRGKKSQVVITAVARELAGFLWAMAREVPGLPEPPKKELDPSFDDFFFEDLPLKARPRKKPARARQRQGVSPALVSSRVRPQLASEGRTATAKPAAGD